MYLNVGSAVVLPEVFLKAVSAVRNLGHPLAGFTTANFDFLQHYRPRVNVVERPHAQSGGAGYAITGHHELMIPLLAAALIEKQSWKTKSRRRARGVAACAARTRALLDLGRRVSVHRPAIASWLVGGLLVTAVAALARVHVQGNMGTAELLATQAIIYVSAFGSLALLFRVQYGRPFWRSLGWRGFSMPVAQVALLGALTAWAVSFWAR